MAWPALPWSAQGNWYSQSGQASSAQAQSIASTATVEIVGDAEAGQSSQSVAGTISDVMHIIGSSESGQASQRAIALGAPRINGRLDTWQSSQSVAAFGRLTIVGSGYSGQGQGVFGVIFRDPVAINVALKRLLDYPHAAVFDKAPDEQPALRINASGSLTWHVAGGVLTVTANGIARKYALKELTFTQLVTKLESDGITVTYQNSAYASLWAHMLLDGSGDQAQSNGNRLMAYSSDLWAIFAAYSVELDLLQHQLLEALKQMIITKAQREWLDLWGALFNHPRSQGKTDAVYAPEIPREAFRARVNAIAIEQAILDLTGKDVIIEEPWERMFRLDFSRLSGGDRFQEGSNTGYHLIRPVSTVSIDWSDVLPIIHRNKAAGVIVLEPDTRISVGVVGGLLPSVSMSFTSIYGALVVQPYDTRLDEMRLSVGPYRRNYSSMVSNEFTVSLLGECPVSISMQYFTVSGNTWNDPNTWGNFTWNGDGETTTMVDGEATLLTSVATYDIDIVEV